MKRALFFALIFSLLFYLTCLAFDLTKHQPKMNPSGDKVMEQLSRATMLNELLSDRPCVTMTDTEKSQAAEAVNVLKTFPVISGLHNAAVKYFAMPHYRGGAFGIEPEVLCLPDEARSAAVSVLTEQGMFNHGVLGADVLRLVYRLRIDDEALLKAIGGMAFSPEILGSSGGDLRALARLVLAHFGEKAGNWSDTALSQSSEEYPLGTSAMILAVSTKNKKAIDMAAGLLSDFLNARPDGVIKVADLDSFDDLVVAMALGGADAREHMAPLVKAASFKVESLAPPFGIIKDEAQIICPAMIKIGGQEAEAILQKPMCDYIRGKAIKKP